MLTINIKGLHGDESVFPARHVIACRRNGPGSNVTSVEAFDEKFEAIVVAGNRCVTHGTVFVMNDHGQTVATYYLAQE